MKTDQSKAVPRRLHAIRVTSPIVIDGVLSEPEWRTPGDTGFTQRNPDEGFPPTQKTEVWVAYDDAALYVAARMEDSSPDSIVSRIGRRDADLSTDSFYLGVDSYHDKQTAFFFGVTPAGSIQDGVFYNDEQSDNSWDGVWEAKTSIDDKGWTAEFRIPFSQLRFPDQTEYVWGINFLRNINRRNEEDYLVMVPKKESGFVSRWAELDGINNIHPPARLEILPYAVSSDLLTNNYQAGDPFNHGTKAKANVGADLKVGFGTNMTLNASVNPDFGQVEVDPAVVNLTQYETFFDEKRPFFVEGSNFFRFGHGGVNNNWSFNWGDPQFFYSRRIGRPPEGSLQHSGFSDIPEKTTIDGAVKLTGRVSDTWSIGSLHALTSQEDARVDDGSGHRYTDVVEPLASYNVFRASGEFHGGAQGVGIIGGAVLRNLDEPYLADGFNKRAYTLGFDGWTNIDADRTWVVSGYAAGSRVEGSPSQMLSLQQSALHYYQEPDAGFLHIDSAATSMSGYVTRVAVNKQKGNWKFNSALGIISPGFDSNDLGFLFLTNAINAHVVVGYQWYDPDGVFRNKNINVAAFRSYDFGGNKTGDGYFLFWNAQFMNYWSIDGNASYQPFQLDNTITRGGPLMRSLYEGYNGGMDVSTVSRKDVVFSFGVFGADKIGRRRFTTNAGVEWKPGSQVKISLTPYYDLDITFPQWVTSVQDPLATQTYGTRYVFGTILQKEFSANIRLDWTFTPKLSLQLFLQPLISTGQYTAFKEFARPRTLDFTTYGENGSTISYASGTYTVDPDGAGPAPSFTFDNPDFNYKSLRGNAVLRWEYMPGSTLYFAWSHNRTNELDPGNFDFTRDFGHLFSGIEDNVFLVKISYWINP
ncbi:MAG TPA: DUF5916 domain-containing protein [Bacteroidota bacterium]|nr:DUF5916 domain-containing protein [Bacteroidota bacterium]